MKLLRPTRRVLQRRTERAPRDRLSGAGLKPVRAAAVKSRGGERRIKKFRERPEQVSVRKTSESKPFDDASFDILGQVRREPDDWTDGGRRIGGVSRTQAFARNCRNALADSIRRAGDTVAELGH